MFAYLVSISGASPAPAVALIGARYWLRLLVGVSSVRFFLMSFNPRLCVFGLLICKCFLSLIVAYWLRLRLSLRLLGLLIGRGSGGLLRRVLNPIIFFLFPSAVNLLRLYNSAPLVQYLPGICSRIWSRLVELLRLRLSL